MHVKLTSNDPLVIVATHDRSYCRVIGDEVTKIIVNPETVVEKERWMEIFLRAKMGEADRSGYLGHEIVHPTMKKWTRFENRWFVAGPGRLEMYAREEDIAIDNFISIIPLEACEILDNPKTKRQDAPLAFRINVNVTSIKK